MEFVCKGCQEIKPESEYLFLQQNKKGKRYRVRVKRCKACYYALQRIRQRKPKAEKQLYRRRLYLFSGHNQAIVCSTAAYFEAITGIERKAMVLLLHHYRHGKIKEIDGWRLLLHTRRVKVSRYEYKYVDASLL